MTSITSALGAGSGIDTTALVKSLVDAQFEAKNAQLTKRSDALTAQISSVAELKSGITGFATALSSLVRGGSLATQATSANSGIVKVTGLPGATLAGLSSTVEVRALATAQVAAMREGIPAGTHVGTGSLQLQFGTIGANGFEGDGTTLPPITIDGTATLSAIAVKINDAKQGVTASVVSDANGERLVLKGATGAARAFTLTATEADGDPGLSAINIGAGATGTILAAQAGDAVVAVDGVEVRRDTNSITGLVPGVRLDLQSVSVGTPVAIGNAPPTEALRQAVNDIVATFNELHALVKAAVDPITGSLRGDAGASQLMRSLSQLTLVPLTSDTTGEPRTLAEIGIATNRDGTLSVNADRLNTALTRFPRAVESMFVDSVAASGRGLSGALGAISTAATSTRTGLGASEARYQKAKATLTDEQAKAVDAAETMRTRMTQQFAGMEARVAAYKATQTFLEQQVDAWNAQR